MRTGGGQTPLFPACPPFPPAPQGLPKLLGHTCCRPHLPPPPLTRLFCEGKESPPQLPALHPPSPPPAAFFFRKILAAFPRRCFLTASLGREHTRLRACVAHRGVRSRGRTEKKEIKKRGGGGKRSSGGAPPRRRSPSAPGEPQLQPPAPRVPPSGGLRARPVGAPREVLAKCGPGGGAGGGGGGSPRRRRPEREPMERPRSLPIIGPRPIPPAPWPSGAPPAAPLKCWCALCQSRAGRAGAGPRGVGSADKRS